MPDTLPDRIESAACGSRELARSAAADLLDQISDLLGHNGIGQVADLIRDGEYDSHEAVIAFMQYRDVVLATAETDAHAEIDTWAQVPLRGAMKRKISAALRARKDG